MSHDQELRDLNRLYADGRINDDEYERLDGEIRARMPARRPPAAVVPIGRTKSIFPPKRRCRSPDRLASLERRRVIAASGPMPPTIACRFTVGQLAALGVVGDEIHTKGACELTVGEIAARAGVSHRLAQDAVRLAELDGLLHVEERRQRGARNLPNKLTILSRDWSAWLKRSRRSGCRFSRPTDNHRPTRPMERPTAQVLKLPDRRPAPPPEPDPTPCRPAEPISTALDAALDRLRQAVERESGSP